MIIGTCLPVLCEWEAGIQSGRQPERNRRLLRRVLDQDPQSGRSSSTWLRSTGRLYRDLRLRGRVLSSVNLMIAAMARSMGLILLTSDRDFEALPDIAAENWLEP